MPINVDHYEELAGEVLKVYEEAERTMMRRVARRLNRGITQPGWTERKYGEMREMSRQMSAYVDQLSQTRGDMQRQFIEQAYADARAAMISDAQTFTEMSGTQGLTANTVKVVNIMSELNSSMDSADRMILRKVNDDYAAIIGRTSALVATGSITYRDAVKRELEQFANAGITSFVDRAGRSWDMETYAEMATLTAIERATREGYLDAMSEFGYDLATISDHYGACPVCEAWEGVVVSVSGDTPGYHSLADAERDGVFHPRCLHDISVYYEGISPAGRKEPREINEPSTGYSARAQQRGYERQIRRWKRRMAVASTPEEERAAYARVRMYQERLRELIGDYNATTDPNVDYLPRKYWREGGRIKLTDAAKKLKPVRIPEAKPAEPKFNVVNGRDISATWTRREDGFKFAIQDVINAQGFDGKPRIVSAEEFDRMVKAANNGNGFIAQRSYSAPNQETLDAYREQLYRGEWYVDCSTGGAQYGQGMYCAADYTGSLSDGITSEMQHYMNLGEARYENGGVSYVETLTMTTDAKIIKFDDLRAEKTEFVREFEETATKTALSGSSDIESAMYRYTNGIETREDRRLLDDFKWDDRDAYRDLMDANRDKWHDVYRRVNEEVRRYDLMDDGAFAAMRGYDAINAEGHGASGSYTVVLNRTKLIIKEP